MTYIESHPNPHKRQYTKPRRAAVTGAVCVHTAESATDLTLPDGGAEAVARFISTRTTAGSYHSIVDSDSIVSVVPYEWEAWGEGTGGNRWALHLSFACRASQWPTLPVDWVGPAVVNGAIEAARMAAWVKQTVGVTIPAKRITPAEYRAGRPGFISHAELDPGRRTDPGPAFPWSVFLDLFTHYRDNPGAPMPPDDQHCVPATRVPLIKESQQILADAGYYTGAIDADWYTASNAALHAMKNEATQVWADYARLLAEVEELRRRLDAAQGPDPAVVIVGQQTLELARSIQQALGEL